MLILVLMSNNGCWRSEAPRFVMCTPSLEPVSLPWATQHSFHFLPCPSKRPQSAPPERERHARIASCRDHCCSVAAAAATTAIPQTVLCIASLHSLACLPTTAHHAHIASYSSTVFPSSHRRPFAWPSSSQLVYTQATRSHRPSAFQRDTNPDLPVHRGETRLRQAARGSPAPFLVVSVLLALLLAALCKPIALRLWLEPAVETRTHLRNTIHARRQTHHASAVTTNTTLRHWLRMPLV